MLVGAFSIIVTQFQSISNFAAVVARLNSLVGAIEMAPAAPSTESTIEIVEREGALAYEQLTLLSSKQDLPLVKELSASIPPGNHVLLAGAGQAPGTALFRATAGIPTPGTGRIIRPCRGGIVFLPQRPYLPPGTLRQLFVRAEKPDAIPDDGILDVLRELDLEDLVSKAGGLDGEPGWATSLSLAEQQLLAFARAILAAPQFVFLDRVDTTIGPQQLRKILLLLSGHLITCVNNGEAHDTRNLHQAVVQINEDGAWTWTANPA